MEFMFFAVAGFVAQFIDGALGMAYGVTCASLLLAFGFSPVQVSASVHLAEVVTSGVSGHFHWKLGNVHKELFRNLVWPGMAGGALGAYLLSSLPADLIKPWIAVYLGLIGVRILMKARNGVPTVPPSVHSLKALGFAGGMLDALGGGGWGPIVTSTLVGRGHEPRLAIGSVNRAEFFVTLVQSATFTMTIGLGNWVIVAGLCVGGALAAPLAAVVAQRVAAQHLMIAVGILIVVLSMRTLFTTLGAYL